MSPKSEPDRPAAFRRPLWRRVIRPLKRGDRNVSSPGASRNLPGFDWHWYVASYPDLAAAGISDEKSAIRHWRKYGRREGRRYGPQQPEAQTPLTEEAGPPPGFDWRWYVTAYTDLAPAGITDEKSAIRHWREHGRRDGRRFAPRRPNSFDWTTYVDHFPEKAPELQPSAPAASRPLVCPSVDSLFLRAWGDLVCWDDAGSDHVLQAWDPAVDYADVFLNGPYQEIRGSLAKGRMPRPEECGKCLLLRILPARAGAPWDRTFVRMLRVEPSYYCSLDCPGCVPLSIRRQHNKAFQLDPDILDRILADLTAAGLAVDTLDFQGHGEPLLNPRLWEMGRRSRERLPEAWISVTTNAQGRFRPEMARSGFDDFICSIDGADPASYEPYRVHGNFDLAWRFMVDLIGSGAVGNRRLRVVWKYVLFEHNSSPETLLKAQQMARDAGVSELVFVLTRNGPAPQHIRFPSDIPRLEPGPPISFRFHEPSIEDLEARLAESRRLESEGNVAEAGAMVESIRQNLQRFFPAIGDRPERQRRLFEELERTGSPKS
jgi:hypothetical protein